MNNQVLLATGYRQIDEIVLQFSGYEFVGQINFRHELMSAVQKLKPNMVMVSDMLTGNEDLTELLAQLKQEHPQVRFLYMTVTPKPNDVSRYMALGSLVLVGIHPLLIEQSIAPKQIEYAMENPVPREDVAFLLKYHRKSAEKAQLLFDVEQDVVQEDVEEDGYKNVYNVSSIKPGTGKSFISTNIPSIIAKYGKKKNGKSPRIALVEADLQNLSLGTLLSIEDDDYNLKTAMDKIATIVDNDGNLSDDVRRVEEVNKFVLQCFRPYHKLKNLHVLTGSTLTMEEIENIQPYQYIYLVELVASEFDLVFIDTNSSLAHVTTYPLLRLATKTYYVLNLDFNNVRNNTRYKTTLENLDVLHKVEYILNEDYVPEYMKMYGVEEPEELVFTSEHVRDSGFKLAGTLPMIPKSVFLNRLYAAEPIVLDEGEAPYTLLPKLAFARIANQIWELDNLEWLEHEYQKQLQDFRDGKKKKNFFTR
ncbi:MULTISPECIES: ATPase [unclassified Exiguobacterium]|uniref:ATPase n=1 Tax=unclassified Exiguobacterium TaxID=2644629 RepID=UPI001BE5B61E|nr:MULTISPECIES: ATPase [unclassified Exiguobacterium]